MLSAMAAFLGMNSLQYRILRTPFDSRFSSQLESCTLGGPWNNQNICNGWRYLMGESIVAKLHKKTMRL